MEDLGIIAAKAALLHLKLAADDASMGATSQLGEMATFGGGAAALGGYGQHHLDDIKRLGQSPASGKGLKGGLKNWFGGVRRTPSASGITDALHGLTGKPSHPLAVGRGGLAAMALGIPLWAMGNRMDISGANSQLGSARKEITSLRDMVAQRQQPSPSPTAAAAPPPASPGAPSPGAPPQTSRQVLAQDAKSRLFSGLGGWWQKMQERYGG